MNKSCSVDLDLNTLKPVKKNLISVFNGTEDNHYYVPFAIKDGINICARALYQDVSVLRPKTGVETRVRLVTPDAKRVSAKREAFLFTLGFERKDAPDHQGNPGIHYSVVTFDAPSVIETVYHGLAVVR